MKLILVALACLLASTQAERLGTHIIGGVEAAVGAYPWQGALQSKYGGHSCGCSLIGSSWVLTAAHCVHGKTPSDIRVQFGLHDRQDSSVGRPATYYIRYIVMHPEYDDWTLDNDIALLRTTATVQMNAYVDIVPIAPPGNDFERDNCYITGWGVTTEDGGYLANRLQEAYVQVYTEEECSKHWFVNDSLICVGVMNEKGSCSGDSGGPLNCAINGKYYVAGVTSFGTVGCRTSKPSMYTRVSYYYSWINSHING